MLERFFKFKQYGTNARTEVIAGTTTFFTMAYILFVNPHMLSLTGMDKNGVFVATIITSIIGTLAVALIANVPYALAPGMGINAFFTFTVCFAMGFTWQQALALVLVCGIVNTIITVTSLRKMIIKAMPKTLQNAISGGIGMFIAYIGIKDAGLLKFTADAPFMAIIPDNVPASEIGTVVAGSGTVPAFVNFSSPSVMLALFGLVVMIVLIVKKVKGAILIGIIATTIVAIFTGVSDVSNVDLSWGHFVDTVSGVKNTAFKMDFKGLFADLPKTMLAITAAIAFCLTDIFDAIGTFIGTGRKSGIFDAKDEELFNKGRGFAGGMKSRMDRALFADLIATTTGSFFGTSNTTTYVESASGIAVGGRTGFASVITACFFAVSIFLAPLLGVVPAAATAPALIVVGVMMMSAFADIKWSDFEIAAPAFLAAVMMPFSYGITNGIAFGFISYVLIKACLGKFKEIHPIVWGVSALFILNFALQAIYKL